MCQLILPITAAIFLLICLLSLNIFEVNNLRPVLSEGVMPVLKTLKTTILTLTGTESLLIILCRMEKPEKATKAIGLAIGIAVCFYTATLILCIGAFSLEGVLSRTWPFLDLARSFEVEYLLLERSSGMQLLFCSLCFQCHCCLFLAGGRCGHDEGSGRVTRNDGTPIMLYTFRLLEQLPSGGSKSGDRHCFGYSGRILARKAN
ncbi:GerAB/ArcD/ProY family transporter [Paenibacillus polymyxa]|uniref:GerAB/ArcD/ProY family transporter n=1 Tax=Paenibacillus polymyxa TaxID=1406 RepID=UPI0023796EF8|nr:GerAB/ArcD/ProY family transporter [Paenibacillus polymyxa]